MGDGAYRWRPGDLIVRREVWRGRPVGAWAGVVVCDDPDLLALWMPSESALSFTDDFFGAPHPWSGRDRWHGHGVLQLQRPGDAYAVWHGVGEHLDGWYINVQEPFRRTRLGIDTLDNVLDIVVSRDGSWRWKDLEELDEWVARGRYSAEEAAAIRAVGSRVVEQLEGGGRWWGDEWLEWEADPSWRASTLPPGWDT